MRDREIPWVHICRRLLLAADHDGLLAGSDKVLGRGELERVLEDLIDIFERVDNEGILRKAGIRLSSDDGIVSTLRGSVFKH